jgi:hypothetical protein
MDHKILELDLKEIERRLNLASRLVEPDYVKSPAYHAEYFPLFDITGNELKQEGLIINWRAHLAGLRHKTVNAIFITSTGEIVLQRRSASTIFFPSRYSLSAGGHISFETPDRTGPIDPLQKLAAEVEEELGLLIARERFIPIGDGKEGIPNFLHAWVFDHKGAKAMLTVFDPQAKHVGVSSDPKSKIPLSETDRHDLTILVRDETLGKRSEDELKDHHLTLYTRNIELCHFYTVVIGEDEIAKISFADGEVEGFRRVSLDGLVQEAGRLDTTTDSLYTLFFDRTDIANELRERIATAGY